MPSQGPEESRGGGTRAKKKNLLSKWGLKLLNKEGMWQEILHNKYLRHGWLPLVTVKPTDSPFKKGFMSVKDVFLSRVHFVDGSGMCARFLEDVWIRDTSLAMQFPSLYNIMRRKMF